MRALHTVTIRLNFASRLKMLSDSLSRSFFALADRLLGGGDPAGHSVRGNVRRHDGAGRWVGEIGVQGQGLSET